MAITTVDVDEKKLRKARKLTRLKSKKDLINTALDTLISKYEERKILKDFRKLRGIGWEGDLDALRRSRV